MSCTHTFASKGRPQPLPPQVLAGGAAALIAATREDPELPGRPRSVSNLPAPRESIPSPALGIEPPLPPGMEMMPARRAEPAGLPASREAMAASNLPAARHGSLPANLPAPREAIPHPNLPAPRVPSPHLPAARDITADPNLPAARQPGAHANLPAARSSHPNLPVAREAPGQAQVATAYSPSADPNLPAPREVNAHPNLPAPRAANAHPNLPAPKPNSTHSNLPAARDITNHPNLPRAPETAGPPSLPMPRDPQAPDPLFALYPDIALGDLPAPRTSVQLNNLPAPHVGLGSANLPGARNGIALGNLPAPRAAVPVPNLPVSRTAVPLRGPGTPVALARLNLGDRTPPPDVNMAPNPLLAQLDLGDTFPELPATPDGLQLDLSAQDGEAAPELIPGSGLDLDLLDGMLSGSSSTGSSPSGLAAMGAGLPPANEDLGFKLSIEGEAEAPVIPGRPNLLASSALPAIEVTSMGLLEDAVPTLAPHRDDGPSDAGRRPRRHRRVLVIAVGAASAAVVAAAALFLLPVLTKGSSPSSVLGPFQTALDSDSFPAYKQAADALLQQAAQESKADELRAAAAEWLLLARLGHDAPKPHVAAAEEALNQILQRAENPQAPAPETRARALLQITQGKRGGSLLNGIEDTEGGRLALGLAQLAAGDATAAAGSFDVAVSAQPQRLLPKFLRAKALEAGGQKQKAHDAYAGVLKANPAHLGAAVGAARTSGAAPADLLTKLEQLAGMKTDAASPAERAALHVLMGRTAMQLGRTTQASKAFAQALALDPSHVEASLALSEALLREGKFNQALARVQPVAGEAHKTADGLFTLGGAMIATRRANTGLPLIETAMAQQPRDPRGPFFKAWAAEEAVNPDLTNAVALYQEALKLSPTFVPASLRLASLMQRTHRATEALKVLKSAENAGAPPTLLQIAWGEALIVAKQPERAQEVFRKALAADPTLATARLGLASSLEAQGRVGEAKLELDELLTQNPDTEGLRERLAALAMHLGEKDEAITHFQAALASGKAGPEVQVALGRLALGMGKLELAQTHLEKVAEEFPGTPGALYNLGQLREKQGALGKALGEYRRATSYENTPEVQLAYGRVLLQASKEDDAMMAFREAFVLAEAHLEHGRVLLRRGKPEKAIIDFQAAVAIEPDSPEAFLLMGNAYDVLGDTGKAAEAWRNVVRIAPKNVEALYKLGRLEMDRAQLKSALDYLRKASVDVPEDRPWAADVFFQLGYAELQSGSKKNAREALAKYLTLAPTDAPDRPVVEKQLERLAGN